MRTEGLAGATDAGWCCLRLRHSDREQLTSSARLLVEYNTIFIFNLMFKLWFSSLVRTGQRISYSVLVIYTY